MRVHFAKKCFPYIQGWFNCDKAKIFWQEIAFLLILCAMQVRVVSCRKNRNANEGNVYFWQNVQCTNRLISVFECVCVYVFILK